MNLSLQHCAQSQALDVKVDLELLKDVISEELVTCFK